MRQRLFIADCGVVCALGGDATEVSRGLEDARRGFSPVSDRIAGRTVMAGAVQTELPEAPAAARQWDCRNNRLMLASLTQIRPAISAAIGRYGADRIAVVLGTSTGGIDDGEIALRQFRQDGSWPSDFDYPRQEIGNLASFAAAALGTTGPAYTVATACSSSAKVFASARRLIRSGMADAAIVGGADTLCRMTMTGFAALDAVSSSVCNPFSRNRDGITIEKSADALDEVAWRLATVEPYPTVVGGAAAFFLVGSGSQLDGRAVPVQRDLCQVAVSAGVRPWKRPADPIGDRAFGQRGIPKIVVAPAPFERQILPGLLEPSAELLGLIRLAPGGAAADFVQADKVPIGELRGDRGPVDDVLVQSAVEAVERERPDAGPCQRIREAEQDDEPERDVGDVARLREVHVDGGETYLEPAEQRLRARGHARELASPRGEARQLGDAYGDVLHEERLPFVVEARGPHEGRRLGLRLVDVRGAREAIEQLFDALLVGRPRREERPADEREPRREGDARERAAVDRQAHARVPIVASVSRIDTRVAPRGLWYVAWPWTPYPPRAPSSREGRSPRRGARCSTAAAG